VHFLDDRYLDQTHAIRPALIVAQRRALQRIARIARSSAPGSTEATSALIELAAPHRRHRDFDARWDYE
jgi:hypothetical protein